MRIDSVVHAVRSALKSDTLNAPIEGMSLEMARDQIAAADSRFYVDLNNRKAPSKGLVAADPKKCVSEEGTQPTVTPWGLCPHSARLMRVSGPKPT